MLKEHHSLKGAAKAALGLLAVLLAGSFVFYRERMFTDAAFVLFQIINHGAPQIQVERYGSFISQLLPVLGVNLHWPLKAILVAYSASFNLFYFGAGLLLYYKFRDYPLTILLALYYSLFVTESYFWTNIELHQGVCWMFMMYGFLRYYHPRYMQSGHITAQVTGWLVFFLLAFLAIFSHPGVIFPLLFLWGFFWIRRDAAPFNQRAAVLYLLVVLAVFGLKFLISARAAGYDSRMTDRILKSSPIDLLHTFTGGTADWFWKSISRKNWLLPLMWASSLAVLARRKQYGLLAWIVLSCIGYFIVLCITFGPDVNFYVESEFMPITIFGASAFVYTVLPAIRRQQAISLLMTGVFLIRLCFIGFSAPAFIARTTLVDRVLGYMRREGIDKMILLKEDERFELASGHTGWGMTYESMFHSALQGDVPQRTFANINREDMAKNPLPDSLKDLQEIFGVVRYPVLNHEYFKPDTARPYTIRAYDEVFRTR